MNTSIDEDRVIHRFFTDLVDLEHYTKTSTIHAIVRDYLNDEYVIRVEPYPDSSQSVASRVKTTQHNGKLYLDTTGHKRHRSELLSMWDITSRSMALSDIHDYFWWMLCERGFVSSEMANTIRQYEKFGPPAVAVSLCDKFKPREIKEILIKDIISHIGGSLGSIYLNHIDSEFVDIEKREGYDE